MKYMSKKNKNMELCAIMCCNNADSRLYMFSNCFKWITTILEGTERKMGKI